MLFFFIFFLTSCQTGRNNFHQVPKTITGPKPKNVILLIGDGLGLPQLTGAMYMNSNKTVFEKFKSIGFHKSHSSDNLITDNAAGATAIATGVKTNNGMVGMDAKRNPVSTLLELSEKKQMATGIVAVSSVTDATPAAFYAHVEKKEMTEAIALDLLKTPVDIFIGSGHSQFVKRTTDNRDLTKELEDTGYVILTSLDTAPDSIDVNTLSNIGYFTAEREQVSGTLEQGSLIVPTAKAIQFLHNRSEEKGFFLLIDGSSIDWGKQHTDALHVVQEIHEFEKLVSIAVDFAKKDGNTLVVVTSGYETGGFALHPGSTMNRVSVSQNTKSHTALLIPIFALGPGEEIFRGIYDNTAIFHKISEALSLSH